MKLLSAQMFFGSFVFSFDQTFRNSTFHCFSISLFRLFLYVFVQEELKWNILPFSVLLNTKLCFIGNVQ